MAANSELRIDNGDIIKQEKYTYENYEPEDHEYGWCYRLYRSGWVEMWFSNTNPFEFTVASGSLWRSTSSVTIQYPFGVPLHSINVNIEDQYAFARMEYANDFEVRISAYRSEYTAGIWYLPTYIYLTGNMNWRTPGSNNKSATPKATR